MCIRDRVWDVPPEALEPFVREARATGAAGNVTIPHKEAVAAACDRLTALAQRVGAVNTFWMEGGVLVGDNTDVEGFQHAARTLLGRQPAGITVGLLGAGGAAAAGAPIFSPISPRAERARGP